MNVHFGSQYGCHLVWQSSLIKKKGFNSLINSVEGYLYGFCHFVKKYFVCVLQKLYTNNAYFVYVNLAAMVNTVLFIAFW